MFYGWTVTQYIVQQRITKAKELLRFSEFSIAEVVDKSGYSDITYFTRSLKKIVRMTPTEYRKSWRGTLSE